jgi:putative membrane protein
MRSDICIQFRSLIAPASLAAAIAVMVFAAQPDLRAQTHGTASTSSSSTANTSSTNTGSSNASTDGNSLNQQPDGSGYTITGQDMMDKAFVRRTIARSRLAVQMGQMALQKSTNESVRKIAEMVIRDRGHLDDTFTTLAKSMNVPVSDLPGKDQADVIARLDKLSGPEFDSSYLKVTLDYQKEMDEAFHREGSYAANNDLKNITSHVAPILHAHRERVEQLAQASTMASK